MHSLNNEHIFSLFKEWTFVSRKLYFCIVVFPQCQFLHFHFPPFTALINVLQLYFLTCQYFASCHPLLCSARIYIRTFPAPLQSKVLICNFSLNSPTPFLGHVSPSSCSKYNAIFPLRPPSDQTDFPVFDWITPHFSWNQWYLKMLSIWIILYILPLGRCIFWKIR